MSGGEIAGLALLTQERPRLTVGPFCVAPFDRVLIVQFASVVCQRRPRYPSSILIHRGFRRLVRPERREAKGDHPRRDGRVVPSTESRSEGRSRPSLRRFPPQMGSRTGALLPKAPSASVVPASRPRAAVPIWTNPTVSVALSGLPLTDARMPALELRGTKTNSLGRI